MIKAKAIFSLYPNVVKIIDDATAYDADGNAVAYNETTVQAYIDAHAYIAKRQAEYPPMTEQLDMIFHNGIDAWKEQIQAVKDKYPKG